ncbi:MAG: isoaspartyl peptidase/L-asparaginase [Desulfuromonadales bacterium]
MRRYHHVAATPPVLLIHGGAGPKKAPEDKRICREAMAEVVSRVWPLLLRGESALKAVALAVELLEETPLFNAGLGSVLQSDGMARLSASVMDGEKQKFSGVALVTHLVHPSRLALALQGREQTVLGPTGAQLLARELGVPPESPVIAEQAHKWAESLDEGREGTAHGTVGAVALDVAGRLAAATSTGGADGTVPERMSDSATVAGNYASAFAAISCTGLGEQIIDDGVAVRIETRVRDGQSIVAASERVIEEAAGGRSYGWIGVDREGSWVSFRTTEEMIFGAMSRDRSSLLTG